MDETAAPARGRPRSQVVDHALLDAAFAEFSDHGFRDMSMEAIAARAGVSKVSLYRRWPSKLALTQEILRRMSQTTTASDQGSLRNDVRHLIAESVATPGAQTAARILMRTMGEISGNPGLLALYREHLLGPRLEQIHALIERARRRGEVPGDLATDVIAMAIAGPIFAHQFSVLTEIDDGPPNDVIDQMSRTILTGIASKANSPTE